MDWPARLWELVATLAPADYTAALVVAASVPFLVDDRRFSVLALAAQFMVLGVIIGSYVYRPILYLFAAIGVALGMVFYLSAGRVQREVTQDLPPAQGDNTALSSLTAASQAKTVALQVERSGTVYGFSVLVLAGLLAYGLWQTLPTSAGVPAPLNLASYWLMANGMLLALTGTDPLRIGHALLTFVNGAVIPYLLIERSLLVFAMLGVLYGIIALSTVTCTEAWLETARTERTP
jgi:hypothetical protein